MRMRSLLSLLIRITFQQSPSSQSYDFSSSHVWMWELESKESWALKNWYFWTVVLEKTLESKKIQPVHPEGNQSWVFIGRTDAEAETPILWPLIWKDPDAGKDWRLEGKGMTEDEMVGWHHWLNGDEFQWTLRVGNGQGSLAFCSPWGCKESDTTERLNWTELINKYKSPTLPTQLWKTFPTFVSMEFSVSLSPITIAWIKSSLPDSLWPVQCLLSQSQIHGIREQCFYVMWDRAAIYL